VVELSSKDRAFLRSIAGCRDRVGAIAKVLLKFENNARAGDHVELVLSGSAKVSSCVSEEDRKILETQLGSRELVKVKLAVGKRKIASVLADRFAAEIGANVVHVIGHTAVLYRRSPSAQETILLPSENDDSNAVNDTSKSKKGTT